VAGVYFPDCPAFPPSVPGFDSTPGLPPPTAPPLRRSWPLSYLFSVTVLGSTFFPAAGPDVVPVCCAKAGAAKARPKATSVVAIRRFMVLLHSGFIQRYAVAQREPTRRQSSKRDSETTHSKLLSGSGGSLQKFLINARQRAGVGMNSAAIWRPSPYGEASLCSLTLPTNY